jgi:prevent-host-death family protein
MAVDRLYIMLYTAFDMTNLMSISDAREQLPKLVSKVNKYMDRFVITVKGQPKATLISAEELESLEETAEILAIPGALTRIRRGEEQIRKGEVVRLKDLDK